MTTRPMVKYFKSTHAITMTSHLKQRNIQIQLLFQNYLFDSDKNFYTSYKHYKTYGKKIQVDQCSNYDVTPETTKYYNPAFISKLLV